MNEIGFDLISDLYLDPNDSFNWEGKATSLYCIVAGNISNDSRTIIGTLGHLSHFYQGVFYVPGPLEFINKSSIIDYTELLTTGTRKIQNVANLYHNVIIIEGIAILGVTGWTGNIDESIDNAQLIEASYHDLVYLQSSIARLQRHLDVKQIVVVTCGVPNKALYYKEEPDIVNHQLPLVTALSSDSENKVSHWLFGNHEKVIDAHIEGIHYVNNPYLKRRPYWAKRITINL